MNTAFLIIVPLLLLLFSLRHLRQTGNIRAFALLSFAPAAIVGIFMLGESIFYAVVAFAVIWAVLFFVLAFLAVAFDEYMKQVTASANELPASTIAWLVVLTLVYLTFELAFNSRLLDVVGGSAGKEAIDNIEFFGRSLSGTAAALFLLQYLLTRRANKLVILVSCSLCIVVVFYSLQSFVDYLVDSSSPTFRRHSANLVLVQNALVNDRVSLAGINEIQGLYRLPEGKVFLAFFPVMAVSVDKLDQKLEGVKAQLLRGSIGKDVGGVQGYYDNYVKAIKTVTEQWRRYRGHDLDDDINKSHKQFWESYKSSLARRGKTPASAAKSGTWTKIARDSMRKELKYLPENWQPDDEKGARAALAREMREKVEAEVIKKYHIAPGLSQAAFIAAKEVQQALREQLGLPPDIQIPLTVNKQDFIRIYDAMCVWQAKKLAEKYDAPVKTFADGEANAEMGLDAARAALVPPVALFFSLLGAIGHLGKLCYLLVKFCAHGRKWRMLWLAPVAVIAFVWVSFSRMENQITRSDLYFALREQALKNAEGQLHMRVILNAVHVVVVGQGFAYPFNEGLRTNVLQGITFGYEPEEDDRK